MRSGLLSRGKRYTVPDRSGKGTALFFGPSGGYGFTFLPDRYLPPEFLRWRGAEDKSRRTEKRKEKKKENKRHRTMIRFAIRRRISPDGKERCLAPLCNFHARLAINGNIKILQSRCGRYAKPRRDKIFVMELSRRELIDGRRSRSSARADGF